MSLAGHAQRLVRVAASRGYGSAAPARRALHSTRTSMASQGHGHGHGHGGDDYMHKPLFDLRNISRVKTAFWIGSGVATALGLPFFMVYVAQKRAGIL